MRQNEVQKRQRQVCKIFGNLPNPRLVEKAELAPGALPARRSRVSERRERACVQRASQASKLRVSPSCLHVGPLQKVLAGGIEERIAEDCRARTFG